MKAEASEIERVWAEFHRVVNMTSRELADWLRVAAADEGTEALPDQAGPELGRQVLHILGKRKTDLTQEDVGVMNQVVDLVHAERRAGLEPEAGRASWRYGLMNLGHDPLKAGWSGAEGIEPASAADVAPPGPERRTRRFGFRFSRGYRIAARPFGVTPSKAVVTVGPDDLEIRFGPWRLRTPRSNVASTAVTGPYRFLKTAGPAHLSMRDRGVTFATNGDRGVCIRFREPVPAILPVRRVKHPGVTVTVADPEALVHALR